MEKLFAECCSFIDAEYKRLGHTLGYRFLLCPKRVLNPRTRLLYLGLNPGGKEALPEHPCQSCENGSAFFTESWKGKKPGIENLQVQTQRLFEELRKKMGIEGTTREFADSHILSAYFIPFRSPSWQALPNRQESIKSARTLWTKIFSRWLPDHILTLGGDTYAQTEKLLQENSFQATPLQTIASGWGETTLAVREFHKGEQTVTVGRLLHLSTFKIMGKPQCASAVGAFLNMMHLG